MKRWYVVQTQAQGESRAELNLARQGFQPFLPRVRKRRRHARRSELVRAPLFPGYIFVRLDREAARWRSINGTFGVRQLICQGERPLPLPDAVIAEIHARQDEEGLVRLDPPPFAPGQKLRIEAGTFSDLTGLFAEMADRERVVLLLELLGRRVPVRVPLTDVSAVA